jgi:FkbM family methyltransferase
MRFVYHFDQYGVAGNIDSGGNTETATREKLISFLKPNSVFFDVGAHEGLYSISVKKQLPHSIVHSFEPQPAALLRNLELNGTEAAVHSVALGDCSGMVAMTQDKRSSNHISDSGIQVEMVTLDALLQRNSVPPPDAIKIDVEGFEPQVLQGAKNMLAKFRPLVITEINHCLLRYHRDLSPLFQIMQESSYSLAALQASGALVPINTSDIGFKKLPYSEDANYWWLPPAH